MDTDEGQRSRDAFIYALIGACLAAFVMAMCGCAPVTTRVAGQANDYAYLYARWAKACAPAIVPTPAGCVGTQIALVEYHETLVLADAAVQRKGPLKLTEAQLKADRKKALEGVRLLEGVK